MTSLPFKLLTRDELREVCGGISDSTLARWMVEGRLPRPIPGTSRWHPAAVEQALARAAGLADSTAASGEDDPFLAGLNGQGRV